MAEFASKYETLLLRRERSRLHVTLNRPAVKNALNPTLIALGSALLSFRMFRESDLDAYAAMCGDPDVMRYLGGGYPLSRDESWRNMALVLGHWQLRGFGLWAVEERATGLLAGRVGC